MRKASNGIGQWFADAGNVLRPVGAVAHPIALEVGIGPWREQARYLVGVIVGREPCL